MSFLVSYSNSKLTLLGLCLLAMTACAQIGEYVDTSEKQEAAKVVSAGAEAPAEKVDTQVPEYKDFPPDTLYALMLAEIAIERDMPDLALGYYRREAYKTRDPGVIKRALEISSWMEAHKVSLELISLWREVEPQNPMAHTIMAQQQLYFGLAASALDSIEKVLALDESFNFDYFNQVMPELDESERLEVLRRLELLSEQYPRNSQLWLSRAHIYGLLDQRQAALEAAEKALRLESDNDRALLMHAELQFNYNDHDKALREMQKGLKKFPDSKPLHFLYAQSLLKLGKISKAREQIEYCVKHFHRDFEFHFRLAGLGARYTLYDTAEQLFQRSVAANYRERESYFFLSEIAQAQGNLVLATNYLRRLRPGPGFLEARLEMAYLLDEQGKLDEAISSLVEARFLQSDEKGLLYQAQADLLDKSGEKALALEVYNEAVEALPMSVELRYARSMLADSMNRLEMAERDLRKVIELQPDNALALNALGYTLTNKTDRHQEALVLIERAYALRPDDPAIIDSMGWVHYQLGNYDEALSYLRKAIALQADHEIAAHLGEVLWVSGAREEAVKIWDAALAENQDSEILKSVMRRFMSK